MPPKGGLGGPARTLASLFGCKVIAIDLTESYVQAAEILTDRIGLGDQVGMRHGVGASNQMSFLPKISSTSRRSIFSDLSIYSASQFVEV